MLSMGRLYLGKTITIVKGKAIVIRCVKGFHVQIPERVNELD